MPLRTELDGARMWLLRKVVYQDDLCLFLAEMFAGNPMEDRRLGNCVIEGRRKIEPREDSRHFIVRFPQFVAWQVVDETYTTKDDYEQCDDTGVLQILSRSKYLDYIKSSHGWFEATLGPAKQYRVCTANEIVDVVACQSPTVGPWTGT
ncbi:MAG: hypothetical protein WC058_09580 [Phycisphaeraceae bacterium]